MTDNIIIEPEAELDLEEAYLWYEENRQGLGAEFLSAIDYSLSLIRANPLAYPIVYEEVRRALVRKFSYGIFDLIKDESIVVIACFHNRRNPQLWQSRL